MILENAQKLCVYDELTEDEIFGQVPVFHCRNAFAIDMGLDRLCWRIGVRHR